MKRMQDGINKILIIILTLIISMNLSACAIGNERKDISTTPDITDKHSESGSADTQTVTDLTVEDVPELLPDVLKLREKRYETIPFLETQDQLSIYIISTVPIRIFR